MTESYEQQLQELARELVHPERFGDAAMQDTIEFEPIRLVPPLDPEDAVA